MFDLKYFFLFISMRRFSVEIYFTQPKSPLLYARCFIHE